MESFDAPLKACPLCGSSALLPFDIDWRGVAISRCGACRVRLMNPQYRDDYLTHLYGEYIPEDDRGAEYSILAPLHHYHLSLVERWVPRGRLLAVGCGSGVELRVALERGWSAQGFDVDARTVARVSSSVGVPVTTGRFAEAPFSSASFDCVYAHHVLEHPKNPAAYLRRIFELLRPGGVLFLACPNIDSLSNRTKTFLGRIGLKRDRGRHYDTWHHLFYYSPRGLARQLENRFGFEVLRTWNGVKRTDRGGWVRQSLRIRLNDWIPRWSSVFLLLARRPLPPS